MQTESIEYQEYLTQKYLPGRALYLKYIFYPAIFRLFKKNKNPYLDLGCGAGEFLNLCASKGINSIGIDSNESLVSICRKKGLNAIVDNICDIKNLDNQKFDSIICDNVLEHIDEEGILLFFQNIRNHMSSQARLVCIVPGQKGFQKDPTHVTFVNHVLIKKALDINNLKLIRSFNHPIPMSFVNKYFYLNMQVFVIGF